MNFAEMLEEGFRESGRREEPMTDKATIRALRECFAAYSERETFKPGQIIVHKMPKFASVKSAGEAAIFVRYLSEPIHPASHPESFDDITEFGSNAATNQYDMVMGYIGHGTYSEFFAESRQYRAATEDDYGDALRSH